MKKATFVKRRDGHGEGRIYKVEPPLDGHDYVWVSAVDVPYSGPETYIFGCDKEGKVEDWGELDGSYRGGLNHEKALRGAGYTIAS